MDIHGDQIEVQFRRYGAPQLVLDYLESLDVTVADLSERNIPDHGVAAVKELMAYTTGNQVVLAIAALALGQLPAPVTVDAEASVDPVAPAGDDDEDDDGTTLAADANGRELAEGMRVTVRTHEADGSTIEGGGNTGEIEMIERRGGKNYVSIETDPEPGHTAGNLISVVDTNLEVVDA
jgi:hypothetical protein